MTSVRTPRTGGADGAVPAYRAAPSPDSASGLGAHLSAERDAFNGERIGMTDRIVTTPSVTIRSTTQGAA
jgi:hypothetical protein